jgi:hypothetical protein
MMTPLRAYEIFQAMQLHWKSDSYDFVLYNGKLKHVNRFHFDKSPEKRFFFKATDKFSNENEFKLYLVPIFLENSNVSAFDLFSESNENISDKWYRHIQKLKSIFKEEAGIIFEYIFKMELSFDEFFLGEPVKSFLAYDKICIETFIILEKLLKFLDKSKASDIIYLQLYEDKVRAYTSFIQIDKSKYKTILEQTIKKKKEDHM